MSFQIESNGIHQIGWIRHASILKYRGFRTWGEGIVYVSTGHLRDQYKGVPVMTISTLMPAQLRDPNWHNNAKVI